MSKQIELNQYGWDNYFQNNYNSINASGLKPGRIGSVYPDRVEIFSSSGRSFALFSGKYRQKMQMDKENCPVTGDWALCRTMDGESTWLLEDILHRKNVFRRQRSGPSTESQNLVANLDYLFICTGLDGDFNLHRMERFLITAWEGGIEPVLILTKSDLVDDPSIWIEQTEEIAGASSVIALSSLNRQGLQQLDPYLTSGKSIGLTGSSGSGKSTLINGLMNQEVQKTTDVRKQDSRGRHTTTTRSLHILPSGAIIVDTPGLREIQLWDRGDSSENNPFLDVEQFIEDCRFSDCSHRHEPGCGIKAAIANGKVTAERYQSYLEYMDELNMTREKRIQQKHQWEKDVTKRIRQWKKMDHKRGMNE